VTEASNISVLSYLGLQLFENVVNRQFQAIPEATAVFQTQQYTLTPPNPILCMLDQLPAMEHNQLQVSVGDAQLFRGLRAGKLRVLEALKLLRRRKKQTCIDEHTDEE
jgi:hypothetical protein